MAFVNNLFKKPKMPNSLFGYQGAAQVANPPTEPTQPGLTRRPLGYRPGTTATSDTPIATPSLTGGTGTSITIAMNPPVPAGTTPTIPMQPNYDSMFSTWGNVKNEQPPADPGVPNPMPGDKIPPGVPNPGVAMGMGPLRITYVDPKTGQTYEREIFPDEHGHYHYPGSPHGESDGPIAQPIPQPAPSKNPGPVTQPPVETPALGTAEIYGALQEAFNMTGNPLYNIGAIGGGNWDNLPEASKVAILGYFRNLGGPMGALGDTFIADAIRSWSGAGDNKNPGPTPGTTPPVPPKFPGGGSETPGGKNSQDAYRDALLARAPNKWIAREWYSLPESTRQFILSGMEKYGWSGDDVEEIIAKSLPQFKAATWGRVG